MKIQKYSSLLMAGLILAGSLVAASAFAQTAPSSGQGRMGRGGQGQPPAVVGTVSTISGDTLTVSGRQGFNRGAANTAAATTYTVDASSATVTKSGAASSVSNIAVGDTVMVQGTVSGTSVAAKTIRDGVMMGGASGGRGIGGTVSAVNGTSLTVTSKVGPNGGAATTYTVDASSATVTKSGAASSVSNIAVGDTVMVQGTVSGTSVAAKTIRDGVSQPVIQGNGQPVVAGSVTAISGSTITITNKSNVTYTVDTTNAKIVVGGVTDLTISNIAVGDNLTIQGAVNGNSVTASSVIDQKAKAGGDTTNSGDGAKGFMGGMMQGIGNFFKKLFGF